MPGRKSGAEGGKSAPDSSADFAPGCDGKPLKGGNNVQGGKDNSRESSRGGGDAETSPVTAAAAAPQSAGQDKDAVGTPAAPSTPADPPPRRRGRPPKSASKSAAQSAGTGTPGEAVPSEEGDSSSGGNTEAGPGKTQRGRKRKLEQAEDAGKEKAEEGEEAGGPSARKKVDAREELTSPRRSSRGFKPNRKYADMEVELVKKRTPRAGGSQSEGQKKTGARTPKTTAEKKEPSSLPAKSGVKSQPPSSTRAVPTTAKTPTSQTPQPMDVDAPAGKAKTAAAAAVAKLATPAPAVRVAVSSGAAAHRPAMTTARPSPATAATLASSSIAEETCQAEAMEVEDGRSLMAIAVSQLAARAAISRPASTPPSLAPPASASLQPPSAALPTAPLLQPPSLAPPASASLQSASKTQSTGADTSDADDLSELGTIAADAGIQVMDTDSATGSPTAVPVGGTPLVHQIEVPVGQGSLLQSAATLLGGTQTSAVAAAAATASTSMTSLAEPEDEIVAAVTSDGEVTEISYESLLRQLKASESPQSSGAQGQPSPLKNFHGKVIVVHPPKGAVITNKATITTASYYTPSTSSITSSISSRLGCSESTGRKLGRPSTSIVSQLPSAATGTSLGAVAATLLPPASSASMATATITGATSTELTFSGADMSEVCPPMSPALVTPVSLTSNPDLDTSSAQLTSLEVMPPGESKVTYISAQKASESGEVSTRKEEGHMSVRKVLQFEDMDEDLANAMRVWRQEKSQDQAETEEEEEGANSKYSTASTQTPIEAAMQDGQQLLSSGSMMKTVSVSMPGEPGHSGGPGRQEIILVTLPEGAAIKQAVVRRREVIDHNDPNFQAVEIDGFYHCNACPYNTSKKANWYKHKRKHMGLRPHQCPHCSYSAATSSNLRRHIAIHEDVRNHRCHICNLMFRQKIHLERHIKYKHEEKSVQCPHCDYVCANLNPDLKIHIRRKHMPADQAGLNSKAFACPECATPFNSKRDLRQHLKFHRKGPELKLYCEMCSFVTDCESRLRRHMCIHTKEKPFKCGLCEYRGSQKEHVLRHMKSQHNIDIVRKHKRTGEGQGMLREGGQSIERDFSSQAKIFACNHCSMKFSKLINLYKHLYTQHKNIMPAPKNDEFSCVVCDFHTSTKKNLLVHMRKHNVNDQHPPTHVYSCVLCSYINPKRRNLFQHMKKKHHIEIVMKDDGSTSCYITDNTNIREESDQHLLTVGDQVIATTSREIMVNEESSSCPVIQMEDLAMIISNPQSGGDSSSSPLLLEGGQHVAMATAAAGAASAPPATITSLDQHEAAEAIVGLTALAGQGVAEGVIEEQVQIMATDDQGTITVVEPGVGGEGVEALEGGQPGQEGQDQLQILSSGDLVEIDGEVYKVEISNDDNVADSAGVTNVVLNAAQEGEGEGEGEEEGEGGDQEEAAVLPMQPNLSIKQEKEDD